VRAIQVARDLAPSRARRSGRSWSRQRPGSRAGPGKGFHAEYLRRRGREREVLVERSVDPKVIDGSPLWIAMDSRAAPVRLSSYVAVVPLPALPSLTRRGTGLRTRGTPMLASTDLADPPA
jgi:hypothetical protein